MPSPHHEDTGLTRASTATAHTRRMPSALWTSGTASDTPVGGPASAPLDTLVPESQMGLFPNLFTPVTLVILIP